MSYDDIIHRKNTLQLNINGLSHTTSADPSMPLLWVLRDELNLTGTKFGCGIAACGACTVHVGGQPVRSCVMPVWPIVRESLSKAKRFSDRHCNCKRSYWAMMPMRWPTH